ncbi:hypothetical protein EYF80_057544 [Liparis tanakae]|uniref:Uncharacterized protein n=1 Tax=Liparis tanakae TaxID=230148 RepID=A0A4Z2ETQ2_9TELE|nr:hypothetical protein EYF80_057544 [Liparis tanakae]
MDFHPSSQPHRPPRQVPITAGGPAPRPRGPAAPGGCNSLEKAEHVLVPAQPVFILDPIPQFRPTSPLQPDPDRRVLYSPDPDQ